MFTKTLQSELTHPSSKLNTRENVLFICRLGIAASFCIPYSPSTLLALLTIMLTYHLPDRTLTTQLR